MAKDSNKEHLTALEAMKHASTKARFGVGRKIVYSIFFTLVFVSSNLIAISHYPKYKESLLKKFEPLASATALGQNWDLFSIPRKVNFHNSAVVSFADGQTRLYEFPRAESFAPFEKFRRYKLRKLFYDYLPNPIGEKYRPSIAKFLTNCFFDKENPPNMVSLEFWFSNVPDPADDSIHAAQRMESRKHLEQSTIFVYKVRD